MNRQCHILRVLSSICVGIMAFCVSFFLAFLLGAILIGPLDEYAFFSEQEVILFLVSALIALVSGVMVSVKYYAYLGKPG